MLSAGGRATRGGTRRDGDVPRETGPEETARVRRAALRRVCPSPSISARCVVVVGKTAAAYPDYDGLDLLF